MESGTSDLTVVPIQEGDESSMVSDPSLQASLYRTSSVVSENIAAGDDLSAGMEPSLPVASSKNSEIIEAEDDPSPGMEPALQTTSSMLDPADNKVNPSMKYISRAKSDRDVLAVHCSKLNQKLHDGLEEKAVYAFLEHNNMTEAQEKVQKLFYLFEAIEVVILAGRSLCETQLPKRDPHELGFKADYLRSDIHYWLFIHALSYTTKVRENPSIGLTHSDDGLVDNFLEYFGAIDFMVFLIHKVQEEEDIMDPSMALQEAKTLVTKCVNRNEEETISIFICLVVNDKGEEAEDLLNWLLKHMKPSDTINRGRVYNYALQKAHELVEVYKYLSSPSLSWVVKEFLQYNDLLKGFATEYDNQVRVQRFLMDLYLYDSNNCEIDWEFVEQHDYPYLIQCEWEIYKARMRPLDKYINTAPPELNYVFTSSAAIVGGQDIMMDLLAVWPTLDVNAPYKGVAALHVAAFKGNEEVIKFLLEQKELDINMRIGQLLPRDDVQRIIPGIISSGKKCNKNRWKLPTYQTALHIAITQGHAMAVKLLCDAPEPHQQRLRCHEKDEEDRTPLDILYGLDKVGKDSEFLEIKKILLGKKDVQDGIDKLYRNRQVLVDAANTILVGAALIAGVTFAPPLGYAQYYDLAVPYPAPPGTYDSYLAVQGNLGVKVFALFNSLSFFFAIATVIVGADAVFPTLNYQYIGHVVQTMKLLLQRAIKFLIISLVCVLGAFGSAAIVVLPPSLFFRKDLVLSIIIGGGLCGYVLWQLLSRHSTRVQRLNAYIRHIIKFTNVF